MTKKTRITKANILTEQRYLSKKFISEDETLPIKQPLPISQPSTTSDSEKLTNPWVKSPIEPIKSGGNTLTTDDKTKISSALWNKINSDEELKKNLGLQPHHTEDNFLSDISHNIHGHVTKDGHMTLEFPSLGKNHNTTLMLGKSFAQHGDSHGGHNTQPTSTPHSSFDVGVKFNLGNLLGGKHNG